MKNKKVFKAVGRSVVCTAMAAMMFTLTACNPVEGDSAEKLSAPQITLTDNVISWSAIANADGYEVIENSTTVCSQAETTYTIDKTQPGTYTYTVKATSTSDSYTTSDASNAVVYTVPAEDEEITYTVAFMLDSMIFDKQVIAEGGKAHEIESEPAKPGYVFTEWLMDNGNPYDFDAPVTSNITLKAGWSAKTYDGYTVSFNTNGGSEIESQSVTIGGYINLTGAPTKENFEFAGWYTDEALTEEFDIENTAVKKSMTLYAKWALADGVEAVEASSTWEFNAGNVANHDEDNNYFVATADTLAVQNNKESFHGLNIDASSGKLTSNGTSWYQFNDTTAISFFVTGACTVKLNMYQNSTAYTVNGVAANADHTYNFYGADEVTIVSTANGYIGKIELTYPEPVEVISVDTTWAFNSVTSDKSNYYILTTDQNVEQGKTLEATTFNGLTLDATASGAKVSVRTANGDTQINANTVISFTVAGPCSVTVSTYHNYYKYSLNGTAATEDTQTYEISRAGTVEFVATAQVYLYTISVEMSADSSAIPAGYEKVETTCNFATLADTYGDGSTKALTTNVTYGKFGFTTGSYFEKNKNDINTQGKDITIELNSEIENTISFTMDPSASGSFTTLTVKHSDGTTVLEWKKGVDTDTDISLTGLKAGVYTISTDKACRISALKVSEILEEGSLASLTVTPVNTKFLINDEFTSSGLSVTAVYGNGSTRSQTNVVIDSSSYDNTKTGEYYIRVFYTENGETVTGVYTVKVYSVEEIKLSTYTTNGNKQETLAGIYAVGDTFSTAGLTVTAVAYCGEDTYNVVLTSSQYNITTPDLSTVGEKTVTVSAKANEKATASFTVNVVAKAEVENNAITVSVDPSKAVSSTNFHTITDAITYLGSYGDNVAKTVQIADGEYYEKVFINIPKVTLIGSAANTPNATTDNGVVIWYDAIAGMTDPSGKTYGTNGSATVTVASGATEFVAKNITFKNYFNTYELYQESLTISSNSQAVALLVEGNKAAFYNCKMTGYHDTLYANKESQYYYNCWIEGHTDFIFGSNVRGYFNNCTIYSIGAGATQTNGGYIVAAQGSGANNEYYVFNGCNFTSDNNVKDGSIALGRAWGANMKMVIINSTISVKYSTAAHTTGTSSGQRYCTMSGNEPNPSYMIECSNTGEGSITASIANTCTYDASAATTYGLENLASILGFTPEQQ